ncbi:MAG: glycosyltransferase [Spirochaetia bacterium]|jgi:glycosyltransferase involved in cell wall biosynthesis|nr:glycosyltransferase [Spirochaetia bacterium]
MEKSMRFKQPFHKQLVKEFDLYIAKQNGLFPKNETLTIDLHVHDSAGSGDGIISGFPGSFIGTGELIGILKKRGCDTFTVTNRNSAESCRKTLRGDVITGAEFICAVPDYGLDVHVLAYGFTEPQERELAGLGILYDFLKYTRKNGIPVIWAHPFDGWEKTNTPAPAFFEKMFLIFENFEAVNGSRSIRQNLMVKEFAAGITKKTTDILAKKFKIHPEEYTRDPYKKNFAGGSDSGTGLFAGETGTRLYVPNLSERLKSHSRSELALEALLNGNMAPFGHSAGYERKLIDLLYTACGTAANVKESNLLEILLRDLPLPRKLFAAAAAKALVTVKKKAVIGFAVKTLPKVFTGQLPRVIKYLPVPKKYRDIRREIVKISDKSRKRKKNFESDIDDSLRALYSALMRISAGGILELTNSLPGIGDWNIKGFGGQSPSKSAKATVESGKAVQLVSASLAAALLLAAAGVKASAALCKSEKLLDELAAKTGKLKRPGRMLWLTDTFEDNNGIAMVLNSMLSEIRRRDLPIDIMACSSKLKPGDHLIITPPVAGFTLPFYQQQPFRIPDFFAVQRIFLEGEYDRIICSTEGPMGITALYLKHAYQIPAHFYMHTDWVTFGRDMLRLSNGVLARAEKLLSGVYNTFDLLFVLNSEQLGWLTGERMGFTKSRVFQTAHWADDVFKPVKPDKEKIFGINEDVPLILFAGRISEEKGVLELSDIYHEIKKSVPNVKLAIAGMGPAEKILKERLPEAIFMGWVEHNALPQVYSSSDMLILPSKFDTFGCVVLEALSCGCPVTAYDTKGPRDIIEHGESGYLASTKEQIAAEIKKYLLSPKLQTKLRKAAMKRAKKYNAETIVDNLMRDVGLPAQKTRSL